MGSPSVGKTATLLKNADYIAKLTSVSITVGGREMAEVDTIDTSLATAASRLPATLHAPTLELEGVWVNTVGTQISLHTDLISGASDTYTLAFPTGLGSWSGTGYVTALSIVNPNIETVTFRATITGTGNWTKS